MINMVSIQILSDAHTEFGFPIDQPFSTKLRKADIMVLAGDIVTKACLLKDYLDICKRFSKYVIFVPGNHEYYNGSTDEEYETVCNTVENVTFLQRKRVCIEGIWFAGATLWSDVNEFAIDLMNDPFILEEVHLRHNTDKKWLDENVKEGDIVVTHHLPSFQLIHEKYKGSLVTSGFASNMDGLIRKLKPQLWICGHTHVPFDTVIEDVRIIINPIGYPGENLVFRPVIIQMKN
jgi:Icc-related predicted phosphoesterase